MDIKKHIAKKLRENLSDLKFEISPEIKISDNLEHSDYYTNVAMRMSKDLRLKTYSQKSSAYDLGLGSPMDVAESIVSKFSPDEYISKVEAVAPGFVNFWVSEKYLFENLNFILREKENFGKSNMNKGKKAVVEFSSPNIAKPFTVGHLRSTIIGNAVANLLMATGWEVYKDNHLGDWGTQFGKQIFAIKAWGNEEDIEKTDNPVKNLVALYVKFHEEAEKDPKLEDAARAWFKKLEDGDPEAKRLWQKCTDWSLKEFEKIYQKLNIVFTENDGKGYGESYFEDKMEPVIEELRTKGLLKKHEGAELVYFPGDKYPPLMIVKSDGTTLYATRDLATDKFRLDKYGPDITIINEVGAEQSLYFYQLFETEKMLGWVKDGQRIHIKHGLYRFKEGKMSTRRGNTVWLEDVLDEAEKRAEGLVKEKNHDVDSTAIGIGALKWNDLKRGSVQDIVFDWEDILNMQGNSGPYIQYTYVRTQSVLEKAFVRHSGDDSEQSTEKDARIDSGQARMTNDDIETNSSELQTTNYRLQAEEDELLRFLSYYPYFVEKASIEFATSVICNYLFELSQKFNLFYQKHKIIGSENENFRLELTKATGQTVKNGLNLLGIETVARM